MPAYRSIERLIVAATLGALPVVLHACAGPTRNETPAAPPAGAWFPSGDVRLSYALDLPTGAGPFPSFVLGHGSGRVTKHEAADLARQLVAQGYAVLRYDKRGVGESTGTYEGVGVANSERMIGALADDMVAGVAFLRTRPEIDGSRIGLMGASQAGWIMPLAAERSPQVRCMVLLVGPTVSVGVENFYSALAEGTATSFDELSARLETFQGPHGYDPRPHLDRLQVPGLWLLGAQDRSIPTRETVEILGELAASGRPYRWIVYPNDGHFIREDFMPEVVRFARSAM
jgi:dienelactone hydrolase